MTPAILVDCSVVLCALAAYLIRKRCSLIPVVVVSTFLPLEENLLRQEANNGNALDLNAAVSSAFATTTVSSATSCWVTLARPLYAI
jgi:hypothetical protein